LSASQLSGFTEQAFNSAVWNWIAGLPITFDDSHMMEIDANLRQNLNPFPGTFGW